MPIFEYKCKDCDLIFEKIVTGSEKEHKNTECKKCGRLVKRIVSFSNFKINGFSEANGYSGSKK